MVGDKEKKIALSKELGLAEYNKHLILDTFGFYSEHKQYHDTKKLTDMIPYMDKEQQELFIIDVRKLDIDYHAKLFAYGLGKFYCGHDILPPGDNLQQILQLYDLAPNHDIQFAIQGLKSFEEKDLNAICPASALNLERYN